MPSPLPSGTVTLLFSDIEGSTRLLAHLGSERYSELLAVHRCLIRETFAAHGGIEVDTQGDAFFWVFRRAREALAAAVEAQRLHARHPWPEDGELRARLGIHTGEPLRAGDHYVGIDVHRAARVMAAGHGGQIVVARSTAELVAEELPDGVALRDLGEHRLKDLSRPQRLFQVLADAIPAEFPPLRALDGRPTNLPVAANRLVDRTAELTDVVRLLRDQRARAVTLTGTGGTGKTRLALEIAAELFGDFADGTFFVPLAPVHDPRLVLPTIAQTFALREHAGQPLEAALLEYLADRSLLLVVDNFEHVIEASSRLASLLAASAGVSLLVTSRQPLHIRGEHVYAVPPLPVPRRNGPVTAAAALEHDAVALFVERAAAAKSDFELTDADAPSVAAICARLDGLPLAIELAAARIAVLSPQALLRRLDARLGVLTLGARDADERQQTLRATIEWSHDLLSEGERALFARFSVFAGGCDPAAASAVCDLGDLGGETFDRLASLADKSLLRVRHDGGSEPRFWMLETIREFAAERLAATAEAAEVADRHARLYTGRAEEATAAFSGADERESFERIERDVANLRRALEWARSAGDRELLLRASVALGGFWLVRGHLEEGRRWLAAALAGIGEGAGEPLRLEAHRWSFALAFEQGDLAAARSFAGERLRLAEASGDDREISRALNSAALAAAEAGGFRDAVAFQERAVALAREADDGPLLAAALGNLAWILERAASARGDEPDYPTLAGLYSEGLALSRQLGSDVEVAQAAYDLAGVETKLGNRAAAVSHLRESLATAHRVGFRTAIPQVLAAVAGHAANAGLFGKAALLLAAGDALRATVGSTLRADERDSVAALERAVHAALGVDELAAAADLGRELALDDAVRTALEILDAVAAEPASGTIS